MKSGNIRQKSEEETEVWGCQIMLIVVIHHSSHYWPLLSPSVMSDTLQPMDQVPLSIGILQARILEWVAMPSSRGSSQPRDQIQVSLIASTFFTVWATREAHY